MPPLTFAQFEAAIDEWLKTSESSHKPTDTDMGLADEQLPLETGAAPASETQESSGETQPNNEAGETPALPPETDHGQDARAT